MMHNLCDLFILVIEGYCIRHSEYIAENYSIVHVYLLPILNDTKIIIRSYVQGHIDYSLPTLYHIVSIQHIPLIHLFEV